MKRNPCKTVLIVALIFTLFCSAGCTTKVAHDKNSYFSGKSNYFFNNNEKSENSRIIYLGEECEVLNLEAEFSVIR